MAIAKGKGVEERPRNQCVYSPQIATSLMTN